MIPAAVITIGSYLLLPAMTKGETCMFFITVFCLTYWTAISIRQAWEDLQEERKPKKRWELCNIDFRNESTGYFEEDGTEVPLVRF